uniref:Uncharacterized protein n=1 Tax=Trichuris muris TaxID=70415 RepID=A0A5S6QIB3_TRIMR
MEIENSESILKTSTRKLVGRYEVGLLWNDYNPQLPNNRPQALGRLAALKRRLSVDVKLQETYRSAIDRLVQNSIAKKVAALEIDCPKGKEWYLSHHGVRCAAKSDKLRVVFDDSAVFNGVSLNSLLSKGPLLLSDLCGLLIRFRRYQIAVADDIDHMFFQVAVPQNDQTVLRYLWKNSSHEPDRTHQMKRQVFSLTSAPASCIYAMNQCLYDHGSITMAERAIAQFFVDNSLDSFVDATETMEFVNWLKAALLKGGFPLSQWTSSSREVLNPFSTTKLSPVGVNMDLGNLSEESVLGMQWNCESDTLLFRVTNPETEVRTRRQLVSAVPKLLDPLGIAAPIMLEAKLITMSTLQLTQATDVYFYTWSDRGFDALFAEAALACLNGTWANKKESNRLLLTLFCVNHRLDPHGIYADNRYNLLRPSVGTAELEMMKAAHGAKKYKHSLLGPVNLAIIRFQT